MISRVLLMLTLKMYLASVSDFINFILGLVLDTGIRSLQRSFVVRFTDEVNYESIVPNFYI